MRGLFRGFGILPNKQNLSGKPLRGRADLRKRVPFSYACSETYHLSKYGKEGKRMDWEPEIKDSGYLPKKGKPAEETVCYKIGGTYYEVSTSCGGSERLRDKMIRLIKSETVKPPNDKQG